MQAARSVRTGFERKGCTIAAAERVSIPQEMAQWHVTWDVVPHPGDDFLEEAANHDDARQFIKDKIKYRLMIKEEQMRRKAEEEEAVQAQKKKSLEHSRVEDWQSSIRELVYSSTNAVNDESPRTSARAAPSCIQARPRGHGSASITTVSTTLSQSPKMT
eukprot:SAG22_NODE_4758_length_1172_cov_1.780056_1_plen_160_part_10